LQEGLVSSLTAVKPEYHHQGIALALKLRVIAYAKEHDKPYIKTWNDSPNQAMIVLKERLDFVRQIGWIIYRKTLETV
jgi:GNAT superfamily N-acetyltransferase